MIVNLTAATRFVVVAVDGLTCTVRLTSSPTEIGGWVGGRILIVVAATAELFVFCCCWTKKTVTGIAMSKTRIKPINIIFFIEDITINKSYPT